MNATRTLSIAGFAACLAIPAGAYEGRGAVFTSSKGGAMAEASVGGQKFNYQAIGGKR